MKQVLILFVSLFMLQITVKADKEKVITMEQLPALAQTFIKKYFPTSEVLLIKMESEWIEKQYNVNFTNGDKIEFDKNGNWKEIECTKSSVPASIVPQQIKDLVAKRYPKTQIVKIEKDRGTYDISLSNKIDLEFDKDFNLIDVDN